MAAAGAGGAGAGVGSAVVEATNEEQFNSLIAAARGALVTVFFWEDFHAASRRGGQMDVVVTQLAQSHPDVKFIKVQAEAVPEVSEKYDIAAVPTFVFLAGTTYLGKQEGANAPMLAQNVEKFKTRSRTSGTVATASDDAEATKASNERLAKLINTSHVMVFMKGTPQEPKCKFSRRVTELLAAAKVRYSAFNILQDDAVRQGLKTYSDWPTYPQVYVAGKLIGGHDVIVEMAEDDPTMAALQPPETAAESLETRLTALVKRSKAMLFMKGSPDEPRCGFSRQAVALLRKHGIKFDHFDILTDNAVRQGLKTFSNWPTFPQFYVNGKLVGGLDILKQMEEDAEDDFVDELGLGEVDLNKRLAKLIRQSRVVLFMKGSPDEPRCGFSRQAIALLREAGIEFTHFDILTDNDVRQGLKTFSNWPTYPQLYVDGKLIGGLDIMKELHEEEELAALGQAAE